MVRHGQASFGSADYDVLSAAGERQARCLGDAFAARGIRPASVVSGSLRRQRDTAAVLAKQAGWALEASVDAGWDEFELSGLVAATPAGQEPRDRGAFQDALEEGMRRWAGTASRKPFICPKAWVLSDFCLHCSLCAARAASSASRAGLPAPGT